MIRTWTIIWRTLANYLFGALVHSESLKRDSVNKLPKLTEDAKKAMKELEADLLS